MTEEDASRSFAGTLSRRQLGARAGAAAGGVGLPGSLASPAGARRDRADAVTITIGFASHRTGRAAGFGEPDPRAQARSSSRTRTRRFPF